MHPLLMVRRKEVKSLMLNEIATAMRYLFEMAIDQHQVVSVVRMLSCAAAKAQSDSKAVWTAQPRSTMGRLSQQRWMLGRSLVVGEMYVTLNSDNTNNDSKVYALKTSGPLTPLNAWPGI